MDFVQIVFYKNILQYKDGQQFGIVELKTTVIKWSSKWGPNYELQLFL